MLIHLPERLIRFLEQADTEISQPEVLFLLLGITIASEVLPQKAWDMGRLIFDKISRINPGDDYIHCKRHTVACTHFFNYFNYIQIQQT